MNQSYPVPPPELVEQWIKDCDNPEKPRWQEYEQDIATLAAQWGADQELEACVNYIDNNMSGNKAREFRAIRRPKPPSLKEQALSEVAGAVAGGNITPERGATIRRALEQLPDAL